MLGVGISYQIIKMFVTFFPTQWICFGLIRKVDSTLYVTLISENFARQLSSRFISYVLKRSLNGESIFRK